MNLNVLVLNLKLNRTQWFAVIDHVNELTGNGGFYCMHWNCQFDEGPKGPKLSWDYTSEMRKCDTGNCMKTQQVYSSG